MMIYSEDEAHSILACATEAIIIDLPSVIKALQTLRQHADGCRSQGGDAQLEKAMGMYNTIDGVLRKKELYMFCAQDWHRQETYHCKFGIGRVFAALKSYGSAEKHMLQAIVLLTQSSVQGNPEHQQDQDGSQLLSMVCCLISDIYLSAFTSSSVDSLGWANKAWHVLSWCITAVFTRSDGSWFTTYGLLHDLDKPPVEDVAVHTLYDLLSSRVFLHCYTQWTELMQNNVQEVLDLMSQVLWRLDKHGLAGKTDRQLVESIDYEYVFSDSNKLVVFSSVRLGCIRRVLSYCELASNGGNDTGTSVPNQTVIELLDFAFSRLDLLGEGGGNRVVYELWGDVYRLRGDWNNLALALCLYAACFHTYGRGVSREMRRLADKIQRLLDNQDLAAAVPNLSLPSLNTSLHFVPFLRENVILAENTTSVVHTRLQAVLDLCKAFLLDEERRVYRHIPTTNPPASPLAASVNTVADMIAPHKLVQREMASIEEMITFFRKDCKIIPKSAYQHAKSLLREKGIFRLNLLVTFVKDKGHEGLNTVMGNMVCAKTIASIAVNREVLPVDLAVAEDEQILLDELAKRLEFPGDAEERADLMILYEAMMSCGQMLACIALCFCEHIAHSLCTVNLDCVKNALVEDPTCFKLEDTYTLLTEGNSLSIAAIMGAWQSFMHTILLRKEEHVETLFARGKAFYDTKNYPESIDLLTKAAKQGHAGAQISLGHCFLHGRGVIQDNTQAAEWYTEAAEQGLAEAQHHIGLMYVNGLGVSQSISEAIEWFEKAAEQGVMDSQYMVAQCYLSGYVSQTSVKANSWLEKVVEKIGSNNKYVIGNCDKAIQWLEKAAEKGHMKSLLSLADCYEQGRGVPLDFVKATYWYRMAASLGDTNAQCSLAEYCEKGQGLPRDYSQAAEWYKKAADKGHPWAQKSYRLACYNQGLLFKKGEGVLQDYTMAAEWLKKAADHGQVDAHYELGVCYEKGHGVSQDYFIAVKYYTYAAEQGNANAQHDLGLCYKNGYGVAKDHTEATK